MSPLEQRRHLSRPAMLYKTYNHLVDTDFISQLTLRQPSTRGHASRFLQPQCSCAAYSNSFRPRTVPDWNALAMDPLLFRLLMPARTTSSLIRHLITCVFNLLVYPPETWLTQPLWVCLLVWSRTVNRRRRCHLGVESVGPRNHVLDGGSRFAPCERTCPSISDDTPPWTVEKWLNGSRCRLGCELGWAQGSMC